MEMNLVGIIRLAACALALLLCVLAVSLPSWSTQDAQYSPTESYTVNSGLWKACSNLKDTYRCQPIPLQSTYLALVGAMVTCGVLLLIGALACAVLHVTNLASNPAVVYTGGTLAALAGLLQLIAFAAYADYMNMAKDPEDDDSHKSTSYGAAFGLDIVTCIVSWVAAVLFLVPQFREIPQN